MFELRLGLGLQLSHFTSYGSYTYMYTYMYIVVGILSCRISGF